MDGWNTGVLLGWPIFRGELLVSGRVIATFFSKYFLGHSIPIWPISFTHRTYGGLHGEEAARSHTSSLHCLQARVQVTSDAASRMTLLYVCVNRDIDIDKDKDVYVNTCVYIIYSLPMLRIAQIHEIPSNMYRVQQLRVQIFTPKSLGFGSKIKQNYHHEPWIIMSDHQTSWIMVDQHLLLLLLLLHHHHHHHHHPHWSFLHLAWGWNIRRMPSKNKKSWRNRAALKFQEW